MDAAEPDQAQLNWSAYLMRGCAAIGATLFCLPLGFCAWISWDEPRSALPSEVEWTDIIGFDSQSGFREGCAFGAYRISADNASAFANASFDAPKWRQTPLPIKDGQHAFVRSAQNPGTLYALHATSCASDDLRGMSDRVDEALSASGNWYYVYNGGEGLVVVDPSARLVWYLYYG